MEKNQKLNEYFVRLLGESAVKTDVPMSEYTTFRAGGNAQFLLLVPDEEKLNAVVKKLVSENVEMMILGVGSNILVRDGGFEGAFVKLSGKFSDIKLSDCEIQVGAGLKISALSAFARDNSLTGLEFACGIPGSVGGGIFMNAGAYGGELADVIKCVQVLNSDGKILNLDRKEIEFSYRNSRFQKTGEIILSAVFSLKTGVKEEISVAMRELMQKRNTKQPVNIPSAGSFFKRPQVGYASKLIEDAGLKGLNVGDAQVSLLHSGFIVNNGSARANDILQLMRIVQETVEEKFDVILDPEVRIVGKNV
ncbi:MAG: UDP-N-acetylmuramate dehydrogenase [Eubacteriales bacterium]